MESPAFVIAVCIMFSRKVNFDVVLSRRNWTRSRTRLQKMSKKRDAKTPDPKPENLTPTPERKMGKRREREEKKGNGSFPILKQTRL